MKVAHKWKKLENIPRSEITDIQKDSHDWCLAHLSSERFHSVPDRERCRDLQLNIMQSFGNFVEDREEGL